MFKFIILALIVTVVGICVFGAVETLIDSNEVSHVVDGEEDMVSITISGEVTRPGTYTVPLGSTLGSVIEKASGLTGNADERCFYDDYKITAKVNFYIAPIFDNSDTCSNSAIAKVNVNLADSESLQKVAGIGASIATAIVSFREEAGLFRRIEEIKAVSGIGDATFTKVRNYIYLHE